ncbi:protein arginine N-methyltransferase, partial [Colletotrichum higginsianum]
MDGSNFNQIRPIFSIGQHDSDRDQPLDDLQYGQLLNAGVNFVTAPITNKHFHARVKDLVSQHLAKAKQNAVSLADAVVPPLTPKDTSLFPSHAVTTYIAYASPWIDLASTDPVVASVSRQVLNLEIAYANFCGVRSIIVPGPRRDASRDGGNQGIAQYGRAVLEAMNIASRLNFIIHVPMYREPGLEETVELLSTLSEEPHPEGGREIDIYSAWDSWHSVRTICEYNMRLF